MFKSITRLYESFLFLFIRFSPYSGSALAKEALFIVEKDRTRAYVLRVPLSIVCFSINMTLVFLLAEYLDNDKFDSFAANARFFASIIFILLFFMLWALIARLLLYLSNIKLV